MRNIKTHIAILTLLAANVGLTTALASDAETSAAAASNGLRRDGYAAATAEYDGRVGFARTDSRSGPVNLARGVAVGVDEDGLSLSISNAVATRFGPAIATNFNISIERDGDVSTSNGVVVARSPISRSVTAGGGATAGRFGGGGATSFATGQTDRFGRVDAKSESHAHRPLRTVLRKLLH